MDGGCAIQCDSGYSAIHDFCFKTLLKLSYSISLQADNSFVINFDSPLSQDDCK